MASTAERACANVETLTTLSPSGTCPTTSLQFEAGARNQRAPPSRAPYSFCWMPPIGPTAPSPAMVPVPAILAPPVRAPGVSLSKMASENIIPADGPPTSPALMLTLTGKSNAGAQQHAEDRRAVCGGRARR